MKNRRTLFIVFAVVALLFIGIGYAALEDTLTFKAIVSGDGTTTNTEDESLFNVGIVKQGRLIDYDHEKVTVTENWIGTPVNCEEGGLNFSLYDEVEFTISGMAVKDEKVTIALELMNQKITNGYAANIKIDVKQSNETDYTPDVSFLVDGAAYDAVNGFDLAQGAKIMVLITLNMPKTLETDATSYTNTYTFTFDAEAK